MLNLFPWTKDSAFIVPWTNNVASMTDNLHRINTYELSIDPTSFPTCLCIGCDNVALKPTFVAAPQGTHYLGTSDILGATYRFASVDLKKKFVSAAVVCLEAYKQNMFGELVWKNICRFKAYNLAIYKAMKHTYTVTYTTKWLW